MNFCSIIEENTVYSLGWGMTETYTEHRSHRPWLNCSSFCVCILACSHNKGTSYFFKWFLKIKLLNRWYFMQRLRRKKFIDSVTVIYFMEYFPSSNFHSFQFSFTFTFIFMKLLYKIYIWLDWENSRWNCPSNMQCFPLLTDWIKWSLSNLM